MTERSRSRALAPPAPVKVRISGPFWSADADTIQLSDPRANLAFRTLFLDSNPHAALGQPNVLTPGTMLALCFVTAVTISPSGSGQSGYEWRRTTGAKPGGKLSVSDIGKAIDSGLLSLLLLDADPASW